MRSWTTRLATLGVLGIFAALGAGTSESEPTTSAPEPAAAAADKPAGTGGSAAAPAAAAGAMPAGAAQTVQQARAAIAANDLDALGRLMRDLGPFRITDDLTSDSVAGAISGWRTNPDMVRRIDAALAGPCEVEPPEDGQIMVTCPRSADDGDPSGSVFVSLSNMIDEDDEDLYVITGVNTVF